MITTKKIVYYGLAQTDDGFIGLLRVVRGTEKSQTWTGAKWASTKEGEKEAIETVGRINRAIAKARYASVVVPPQDG